MRVNDCRLCLRVNTSNRHRPTVQLHLPVYKPRTNHNSLISSDERANAWNISFRISSQWLIHSINPIDKIKLSCNSTFSSFRGSACRIFRLKPSRCTLRCACSPNSRASNWYDKVPLIIPEIIRLRAGFKMALQTEDHFKTSYGSANRSRVFIYSDPF